MKDYASLLRLRIANHPIKPRPVAKSGRVPGRGTKFTEVDVIWDLISLESGSMFLIDAVFQVE